MNFVLVHGAWHGGWCWHRLEPLLRAAGAHVQAPDLPGHGDDATPVADVTLEAYVDRVVAAVEAAPGPVELVGHSMGGVVISAVAERVPERLAGLTYVCAFLPRDGEVLGALGAEDRGSELNPLLRPTAEGDALLVDAAGARDVFYEGCDEEDVHAALAQLVPQALAPLQTPVALSEARFGCVARSYVLCSRDRAVTPTMQRTLLERSPCDPVIELATGHSPFLADAPGLAAALLDIARQRSAHP